MSETRIPAPANETPRDRALRIHREMAAKAKPTNRVALAETLKREAAARAARAERMATDPEFAAKVKAEDDAINASLDREAAFWAKVTS